MGGRGATVSITVKGSIKDAEGRLQQLGNKMKELAPYAVPSAHENTRKRAEYYRVQSQYSTLRNNIASAKAKKVSKPAGTSSTKTFVNSFGEATKRTITNSTYEKQQKSLSKQISKLVKG